MIGAQEVGEIIPFPARIIPFPISKPVLDLLVKVEKCLQNGTVRKTGHF